MGLYRKYALTENRYNIVTTRQDGSFGYTDPLTAPHLQPADPIEEYISRIYSAKGTNLTNMAYRVGSRIRLIRKVLGVSQAELGDRIGITADRVQKIENGAKKPNAEQLQEIAAALGVNVKAFIDPIITDPISIMFALFNMEMLYDLKVNQQDGKTVLTFSDGISGKINKYLKMWEQEYKSCIDKLEHASSDEETQEIMDSYMKWKISFMGESYERILKSEEKRRIEDQIEALKQQLEKLNKGLSQ